MPNIIACTYTPQCTSIKGPIVLIIWYLGFLKGQFPPFEGKAWVLRRSRALLEGPLQVIQVTLAPDEVLSTSTPPTALYRDNKALNRATLGGVGGVWGLRPSCSLLTLQL